jgi:thiol-disulfide isomerase/thioredoxin
MGEGDFAVLNRHNFDTNYAGPGPPVVEFWSENCVPRKQLTRVLSQLSADIPPSVRIGTGKVNDNLELAARFGIQRRQHCCFSKTVFLWISEAA